MSETAPTATGPAPTGGRADGLWRNRDFLCFWSGQIVSTLGSQASLVAWPLLTLALTGSPAWAGVIAAARGAPFVLLALPAGALVDRWDRKRLMIVCDLGRAVAVGAIPLLLLTGSAPLPVLAAIALIEGGLTTLFSIAETTCLPHIVPREQLSAAVAQDQASLGAAEMVGPAIGGAAFGLSPALPFVADSASYLLSALALRGIRANLQSERSAAAPTLQADQLGREIRDGLVWLWRRPLLRLLAGLTGGLNLFSFGYPLILIVLAQRLGASPAEIGLLFASGGVGGIVGSLLVAPLQRRFAVGPLLIVTAWVWAITWLVYVGAPNLLWLAVANALGFIIVPIYTGTQYSYRLAVIPDHVRGRANSVFRLLSTGVQPLSLTLTGLLLEWLGPDLTIVTIMLPQALLALAATRSRALRQVGHLVDLHHREDEVTAGAPVN